MLRLSEPLPGRLPEERAASEIALTLLQFHGALFIVIDGAVFALGAAEGNHLLHNLGEGIGIGADCPGARSATERAHPAFQQFRLLAGEKLLSRVNQNESAVANHDFPFASEI